jgi:hypothetical protein
MCLAKQHDNHMNTQPKPNPKAAAPLPADIIREALELDPTSRTGLRWKRRPRHHFPTERGWKISNGKFAGKPAGGERGSDRGKQYFAVRINDVKYMCHRIVYLLAFGVDPKELYIDHINGNVKNNSPENLRLATNAQNQWNRGAYRNNTSGFKGVHWHKQRQKWQAGIKHHGKPRHLGLFDTPEEAHAAYTRAAAELHGEFARAS